MNQVTLQISKVTDMQRALELINSNQSLVDLNPDNLYVFKGEVSNQVVDSHRTRMTETSLDNFRKDFIEGRPLLANHNDNELPMGRSFYAELEGTPLSRSADYNDKGGQKLYVYFYMQRGMTLNGENSDEYIKGIDAGIIKDLSIRFTDDKSENNTRAICSICSKGFRSTECRHTPGIKYGDKRAFVWVDNARAVEASLVFKGSNPDTSIISGIRSLVEEKVKEMDITAFVGALRSFDSGIADRFNIEADEQTAYSEVVKIIQELRGEIDENKRKLEESEIWVDTGKRYFADSIDKAVEARTRAVGVGKFDEDKYRKLLARADIETILDEVQVYAQLAKTELGDGQRQVKPDDKKPEEVTRREIKASPSAYGA